jgi:hypothetical protein
MHPVASRITVIQAHGVLPRRPWVVEFQPKTVLGLKIYLFARDLGDGGLSRLGAALGENESVSARLSGLDSAHASRPNATVEANVCSWFHRIHLVSSNGSRTPWGSVMWSMSPAALISLLRGTLTPMVMTNTTRYKTNAAAIHGSSGR